MITAMGPRRRFVSAAVLSVLAVAASPLPASAAPGTVDLSWNSCSPVVAAISDPKAGPVSLFASVLGNDEHHVAYQVRFKVAGIGETTPADAWRFDPAGCQTGTYLAIRHVPAAPNPDCPAFQGALASIQIKRYEFFPPGQGYPTHLLRGVLVSTYPGGIQASPAQRYFLAEFVFDHTFSVTGPGTPGLYCGGFEQPLVIQLLTNPLPAANTSSYVRTHDNAEIAFEAGNAVATVNGAVPAEGATWGQVKGAYRR